MFDFDLEENDALVKLDSEFICIKCDSLGTFNVAHAIWLWKMAFPILATLKKLRNVHVETKT